MAISSSYNFSTSRDEIIKGALRVLGVIGEGDTPSTDQYTTGAEALNMMVKAWMSDGLPIWIIKEVWVELAQGKSTYTIGGVSSSGKATTSASGNFPQDVYQGWFRNRDAVTTAWAALTSKTTSNTVYPTTENGFYYNCTTAGTTAASEPTWPTVSGSTVTDGTVVWTAVTWNKSDVPATPLSEQEYNILGNKSASGQPVQYFYKKLRTTGELTVFPVPGSAEVGKRFYILAQTPFSDFDSSSDEADFPQEFYRALKFGLANELSFENGYPSKDREALERRAEMYKTQAFAFIQEDESISFQVDIRRY